AGILSTLSPCVLPLLPLVAAAALGAHRCGVAALAAGLAACFTVLGLFVALIGFEIGLDSDLFRTIGAVLMTAIGLVLLSATLHAHVTRLLAPLADRADRRIDRIAAAGVAGQFAVGALLALVWTPCTGPTLGAATLLAAQGKDLADVA